MNKQILQLLIVLLFSSISSFAQTSQSAEIVSRQLFGDGLMVTRAKIPPVEGLVSNFFFYNRVDEPWNGQQWQKIDVGGGHYKLKKRNANYAMDGGNGGSKGQNVKLNNSSSSSQNLQWSITEVAGASPRSKTVATSNYSFFHAQKERGHHANNGLNPERVTIQQRSEVRTLHCQKSDL